MNAQIRAIALDKTLSAQRKNEMIQAIYNSVVSSTTPSSSSATTTTSASSEQIECRHYSRKCCVETPCCDKFYPCRLCHDETEVGHKLDRYSSRRMKCKVCGTTQPCAASCVNPTCSWKSSMYFCEICRLWNDDPGKSIFHCEGCGICRVGKREDFFHCATCNLCLPHSMANGRHVCLPGESSNTCCICRDDQDDLRTSVTSCVILPCGHVVHATCRDQLLAQGQWSCPKCRKSIVRDRRYERVLERTLATVPMPPEYANAGCEIACNDCGKKSLVRFHFYGAMCTGCASANVSRLRTIENLPSSELTPIETRVNVQDGAGDEEDDDDLAGGATSTRDDEEEEEDDGGEDEEDGTML